MKSSAKSPHESTAKLPRRQTRSKIPAPAVAVATTRPRGRVSGGGGGGVAVAEPELRIQEPPPPAAPAEPNRYATIKIVLVGDAGVGKTSLGWRLAYGEYREPEYTPDWYQYWPLNDLHTVRADGTEREAVIWDLAGQPDYRLIHTLLLGDADLALVLFDPTVKQEPLQAVKFWLKTLSHLKEQPCRSILVGTRTDRGATTLTDDYISDFCKRYHIEGGYVATSAMRGDGLDDLVARIREHVDWVDSVNPVTTPTFKCIKQCLENLKSDPERKGVLFSLKKFRARLAEAHPEVSCDDVEFAAALEHLAKHDFITVLRSSGREHILLEPSLIVKLARAMVLAAWNDMKGLGALRDTGQMRQQYSFPEISHLCEREQDILIDAVKVHFLERNICFHASFGVETYLVFPALISVKKPPRDAVDVYDAVTYIVSGAVEYVYAAEVVLLGYTTYFTRTNQWQNQAEYETASGEVCGFRQVSQREGEIDFVLYFGNTTARPTRRLFEGLFESFLRERDVTAYKYSSLVCSRCKTRQSVVDRIIAGKTFIFCNECGEKCELKGLREPVALTKNDRKLLEHEQAQSQARTAFATAVEHIKGIVRDRRHISKGPSCFISYAWGVPEHTRWVAQLATDLHNAGIDVILDQWDNMAIGSNISRFISEIDDVEYVVVVGTPLYLQKYKNKLSSTGSIVAAEVDLINQRLLKTEEAKETALPILLEGDEKSSLPPLLRGRVHGDFSDSESYIAKVFDLILTLYRVPFADSEIQALRESLRSAQSN